MASSDQVFVASRVQQLDAQVLDNELESLFTSQLKKSLSYLEMMSPAASKVQLELETLLKIYIFRHSIGLHDSSLGLEMLDLKLVDSTTKSSLSASQKTGLAVTSIVLPYINRRFGHLLLPSKKQVKVEFILQALNVINFLVFLTNGRYKSLVYAILGITCGYKKATSIFNPVNYDYMSREVLWFSFAEFVSFILPLINPIKIRNFSRRYIFGEKKTLPSPLTIQPGSMRSSNDLSKCGICNESPVNAREIGCIHCFCYYCVSTEIMADPDSGFSCPKCNYHIQNESQIREVYLKGF